MDINELKETVGQIVKQDKLNLPVGKEEEKQIGRIVDKLRNRQGLNDADRQRAVQLVGKFSQHLSPEQGRQLKGLLEQLLKTSKVSAKDQKALDQIKKML
ncbi:MAG: hypothetical protein PHC60_03495 [Heliobacteriaceae bacterium]|nr:hypothetical protein [Heliobacteriaceae bacterium]